MYQLREANEEDTMLLIRYKLSTILDYAKKQEVEELRRIQDYVVESVPKFLDKYRVILVDERSVGCLLVNEYLDGVMVDEIYLEKEYRGQGIGTDLLKKVLDKHNVVYLWVYKENEKAFKLYIDLGFRILEETETRYLMKVG